VLPEPLEVAGVLVAAAFVELGAAPAGAEVAVPEAGVVDAGEEAVVATPPTVDDPEMVGSRAEKATFREFEVAFPAMTRMVSVSDRKRRGCQTSRKYCCSSHGKLTALKTWVTDGLCLQCD
jgi:hypothetical protein